MDVINELYDKKFVSSSVSRDALKQAFVQQFLTSYLAETRVKLASAPEGKGHIGWAIPLLQSKSFTATERFFLLDLCVLPALQEEFDIHSEDAEIAYAKKLKVFESLELGNKTMELIVFADGALDDMIARVGERGVIDTLKVIIEAQELAVLPSMSSADLETMFHTVLAAAKHKMDPENPEHPLQAILDNERDRVRDFQQFERELLALGRADIHTMPEGINKALEQIHKFHETADQLYGRGSRLLEPELYRGVFLHMFPPLLKLMRNELMEAKEN